MGGTISPNTAAPTVEGVVPKQRTRDDGKNDVKENNFFDVVFVKPDDPLLSEGAPYPPEPPTSFRPEHKWFADGARIEAAFRKYFHRAEPEQEKDSYEVIICHANVIRYFVCRAMQIPPEAWLRMSLKHASLTFVSIRPSGKVSVRGVGEAGHFPPEKLTTT